MINTVNGATEPASDKTIQELTLSVNSHKAFYRKAGKGPPVLLVHGGASDSRDWTKTMEFLSDSYTLYAPDLLGYGRSDKDAGAYYMSDFVEFTLGFMRELDLNPCLVVGHSIGGRVCLEIALQHPEMVRKLALVDTVGFGKRTLLG